MRQVSKLDKAKAQLVLDYPFIASILLKRPLTPREDIPTLAVSDRGTIYYNPKFVETLTVPQLIWGLAHEVFHVVGQHAIRVHGRNRVKWNIAGDAWINDTLNEANIGEPIPNTVNMPGSKDRTVDDIYASLPEPPSQGGKGQSQGGKGQSQGGPTLDGDGLGEDILQEGRPMTQSEINEEAQRIKLDIAEAAQAAKMRGKLPGVIAKLVADILDVKTPWYDILERYMTAQAKTEYSWARPNRRHIGAGNYLPSLRSLAQMGEMLVQIDVSGSISQQELSYYNGHLSRIVSQCRPEKVHVIYVDTQVCKHVEFNMDDEVQLEYYSGGGTDMAEGVRWAEENNIEPAVHVILTDGYTPFPESCSWPTIWCISSDVVSPIGQTVHFEMEKA